MGLRVGFEDSAHRLCGAARHGRLLNDNLRRLGDGGNAAGGKLDIAADTQSMLQTRDVREKMDAL